MDEWKSLAGGATRGVGGGYRRGRGEVPGDEGVGGRLRAAAAAAGMHGWGGSTLRPVGTRVNSAWSYPEAYGEMVDFPGVNEGASGFCLACQRLRL